MKTVTVLRLLCRAFLASVILSVSCSLPAQINFYGIGDLPGGDYFSQVRDAVETSDGIVAVGTASRQTGSTGDVSVMWTPAGGLVPLSNPYPLNASAAFVTARVISADGKLIGGSTRNAASGNNRVPAIWNNSGILLRTLGFLGGPVNSFPNVGVNGFSADGSVAYGFTRSSAGSLTPFRYTAAGGIISIGFLNPGDNFSVPAAHAVSADGNVVVGGSSINGNPGLTAFRYAYTGSGPTGGVLTALPALPGGTFTGAFALTPDGNIMIGNGDSPDFPNGEVIRWNQGGPTEALGSPDASALLGGTFGGVTASGDTVAAGFTDQAGNGEIYIRNPSGWFNLRAILTSAGVDLTGWTLSGVLGMSSDGRLVYGQAQHGSGTEGWVAEFPAGYLRAYGDTTPPVLTLPANLMVEATGPAGAAANYSASAVDEIDGPVPVTYSLAPGSTFALGTTTVMVSATDAADNVATGSFTVTVRDTTAPALTLPANLVVEATGPGGAVAGFAATATDAVTSPVAIAYSQAPGSLFGLGTTTVTATATDAAGNATTGSFTVTVRDTTAPALTLPANFVAEAAGPGGAAVSFAATATDAVTSPVAITYSRAPGSLFAFGTTTVTATATDAAGNATTGSFTVTVRDTTPPVITSVTAIPSILSPANHKMVSVTVTVAASDAVGVVATRIVSITSNEPDNGLGDGDKPNDIMITGALTVNLRAERSGKGSGRVYTITVAASDAAGNTSARTVTVRVPRNQDDDGDKHDDNSHSDREQGEKSGHD